MLIDANIFLEVFLNQEKAEKCKIILKKIFIGEEDAIISNFTIDSILIAMEREKVSTEKMRLFMYSLIKAKGLKIYQIRLRDRMLSLKLIEKYNLDYEDAIILQSALSTNSAEILSFDRHFDNIKEIKRIEP